LLVSGAHPWDPASEACRVGRAMFLFCSYIRNGRSSKCNIDEPEILSRTAVTLCGLLGCPAERDQAVLSVGAHLIPPRGRKVRHALLGLCAPHQRDHGPNRLSPVEMALELTHKARLRTGLARWGVLIRA